MTYSFHLCKTRRYLRRNKETFEEDIVSVSNKNGLSVEKHMEILNLYDDEFVYLEYIGDTEYC